MANLDNFILFDVAECIITDKSTKESFLSKFLTTSSITQSSSETEIRAGRGAGLIALVEGEKSVEISLTNGVISKKWLEMQQGTEWVEDDRVNIVVTEEVEIVDNAGTLEGTVVGTPANGVTTATITNCNGAQEIVALTTQTFVVPIGSGIAEGDKVSVHYKSEVTGESLAIDSGVFPKGWELQLEVPAMDKCTQAVTHKVVFIFDNVRPSSSFDLSFAMGEAIAPEMTLKIMKSCCNSGLGKMIIVPI